MEISLWLLLFCWSAVLPKTLSQPLTTYLVTAPTSLRLDAVETVLVQLFGFTQPVELYVILKSTQGSQSVKYSEERLTLNQANNYQAAAKVQVLPKDLVEGASNVVLLVQGSGINDQRVIDISRSNGFMFIQTDKSLYTPEQSVKVRVYSLNEELRPANRKVILTFKDPEGQKVDISELIDNNNGIPSMQNPFKIPLNPKLGVWSIEATYSKDFDTQAIAVFQVKEYVLPSISITVKPEENFISSDNYRRFAFQISASYVNGVPVRKGVVFIRYGFISNKGEPVIFPNSLTRKLLSPLGVVDVNQDIKALLAGTARYTLESLIKKYLYITVLVQEEQGGISEETEYTAVKFVRSPYSLHLITTPRFVKPGLPYNIKVLVRDPTGQPVAGVPVNIVDKCIVRGSPTSCYCTGSEESQSDGFIERICNIPPHTAMAVLTYVTAAPARSAEGQASFILEAPAYNSPQSRYLYIHHPQRGSLVIGHHVHIRVSAATARNVPSFNVNYMVLSKGKVVTFGVVEGSGVSGQNQFVRFRVTPEMTPSIRLLVYYLIEREVVADSLWIEVEGKCVNSLKTEVRYRRRDQRPKSHLLLDVSTKQDGLVALSAVDTAIFPLRRNHKDPVDMVLRHIELSDQGCGAGGGGDAQGVFQLAGLTLLTNAIHQGSQSAGTCTEAVRAKRSLTEKEQKAVMGRKLPGSIREKRSLTEEQKMAMVAGHGNVGRCCRRGLDHIPSRVTCEQFAIQSVGEGYPRCRKAFQDCCERLVKSLPEDLHYSGRGQAEFSHLAAPPQPAPVLRAKRSLTNAQENELVAGHGKVGRCCRRGLDHIPSRVTCEQFAIQSVRERYPRCRKAFQDCCERLLKSLPEDLHYSRPARPQPAPAPRAKRSLTEAQENELVAGHGNVGRCCRRGLDHIPNRVTCEQFAIQSVGERYPRCRKAFQDCCERLVKSLPEDRHYSRPGQANFSHLAAPPQPAPVPRAKRSLTEAQENELVAGHGNVGRCCRRGLDHIPNRVACEQFAIQSVGEGYPRCRKAFQDCCERLVKSLLEDPYFSALDIGQDEFFHLAAPPQPAPVPRAKRSLTKAQENELVAGHGKVGRCCRRGLDHIPSRVTCEQFAIQSVRERYPRCRKAFQDCCERLVKSLPEDLHHSRGAPAQPAPAPRAKRSLTEAQENELVAGHGNVGRCCRRGLDHIPSRVTCEQFAIQSVGEGYPRCRKAFQDCCERLVKSLPEDLHYSGGQANFSHLAARPQPAPVPRAMRSLTEAQENELVAGHGNIGRCCRRGLDHIPRSVTCEQFAIQSVGEGYPSCRKAFQDCCERLVKSLPEDLHYFGLEIGQAEFSHLAAPAQPAPVPRAKRSLTEAQENELVAGHGNVGKCCRRGLGYIPNSVTCEQFAIHSIRQAFPSCRKAFQDCCERSLAHITGDFQYSRPGIRPGLVRAKRSLTEAQKNELVAGHGNVGRCCRRGLGYLPSSVTCEQFAIQSIRKTYPRCRKAFQDCCERSLESLPEYLQYSRDMGSDLDMAPSVRSYFPESWLWEVQPVRDHLLSVNMSLPDSLTTWQITAVGMFQNGICVQDPVQVSVSLPVSVNIPLPYQLVRGEQLDLLGSVYNENIEPIQYCVTLTVGPEFCLLHSQSDGDSGLRTTACVWTHLSGSGVGKGGPFTLLGLKPGEHTLIFTLRTRDRPGAPRDIVKKKLRVVPEGVRKETSSVGTLDPQGIYGSEKIKVLLKNRPPPDLVPDSSVERSLSFNGVIMGKMLSVILEPEGLGKLIRRPLGSAEAGLDGLLPLIHVYRYLEWNDRWNVLGEDVRANIFNLKTRIKEGVVNMLSFRVKDNPSSYSLWMKGKPSTRLTAKVVHTLALLKDVIKVDYTSVGLSVDWLINAQNGDGSFRELALDSKRVTADPEEHSVYLTSFVLISLKRATQIKHSALQQQSQRDAMTQAVLYISQHVMDVKSLYVRAVATYALTYHNIDNEMATTLFENLEGLARQKVGTMELRYWQESNVAEWQQPDQSSGLMVATTAYVMLTSVFKGRLYYVKPIVNWLTQDQHYGGGFYSTEDMVLTLEAITEYSLKLTRSELNQDIVVSGKDIKALVKLRENLPMVPPVQVHTYGDITVSTGYGNGVSHVELKTVYYQTTVSLKECNFDFNIELTKKSTRTRYHSLTACVKYRPPPNEVEPESGLTVLEIHLPTGVQPNLNELEPFKNGDIPAILSYKMRGNVVIIEMEYVPSDIFRCIGFRVRAEFNVVAAAKSIFRVFESEVQGSVCEKQFSFAEEDLQRLCFGKECQCMKAACATYRGNSTALTAEERILETCYDHIQYAYKVKIKSAVAEGDFMTYTAIVVLVLKQKDQAFEGVRPGVEVALVKKATCSWVELHKDAHFIVQGSRGSELLSYDNVRYRFPLDLDAVLELLPDCGPTGCMDSELNQYEEDLQIFGCG
ncbi:complement C5 isoform X3 [Gadus morhua]|uniref:complement C5 isoform X3 n=1 Tax=Gadus morhua TaxID=8049 RepID=UPI0011B62516|nr:complement C5 isoform X3 [Gadus morhua]